MDFPDRLIDHIERNMNLYSTILIPMLQEGNSIALTPIPSSDAENVYYMDGKDRENISLPDSCEA